MAVHSSYAQWLANRGYVVLQPNFRAPPATEESFLNAGNKQWGLKMHDDLIDAVNWAVKAGLRGPQENRHLGGSYGGYCALAAITFTPDVFACAVDIVGRPTFGRLSIRSRLIGNRCSRSSTSAWGTWMIPGR